MRTVRFAFDPKAQMNISETFALANLKAIENGVKPIFKNEKDMIRKAIMLGLQEIREEYMNFNDWHEFQLRVRKSRNIANINIKCPLGSGKN